MKKLFSENNSKKEVEPARISRAALLSALEASRNVFPNEFIGLFREKEGVLCELVLPPFSEYGPDSSGFVDWHLPLDSSLKASFHSHPGWSNLPSEQDLSFFQKTYLTHFIACRPYAPSSTACYSRQGEVKKVLLVD